LLASLGEIKSVGASLGSFSVSSHLLFLLLSEFATELAAKKGKLDSDPHLWMPMTLDRAPYLQVRPSPSRVPLTLLMSPCRIELTRLTSPLRDHPQLMGQKGIKEDVAGTHFDRIQGDRKAVHVHPSCPHILPPTHPRTLPYPCLLSTFDARAAMMARFHADDNVKAAKLGVFGPVDVGQGVLWWDYGQLQVRDEGVLVGRLIRR
jgi:hypothetical protein